jgi:tRNA A-37 threonylcarbamoyl transferase component Bud32
MKKDISVQLAELHRLKLIHADVKLSNIIRTPNTHFELTGSL